MKRIRRFGRKLTALELPARRIGIVRAAECYRRSENPEFMALLRMLAERDPSLRT